MSEKQVGHERALLLKLFLKRGLSENTELTIARRIGNGEKADERAKQAIEIINDCKTEEEILKAINNML